MDLRTGAAFWPIQNGLIGVYPALGRTERADVAVIGAGITGALAAHRLAESGCDVVVLDRHDVAMGSTAATTGLLQYETDTSLAELSARFGIERAVRSWQLGRDAIERIAELCPDESCFARRPSLYLTSTSRAAPTLRQEYALRASHGFDVSWLDEREIVNRFGFRRPGAILSRDSADVDAYRLTHHLLASAIGRGARVYDRTNVAHVTRTRNGVVLETDRGPRVRARRLVVASGYEVARQLRMARGQLHSTWAMVSEPVDDLSFWPERCLIWETRRPYLYLRTTADGRIMAGGEDEPWSSAHEDLGLMRRKVRRLTRGVQKLFPKIELETAYAWAGVFGTTRDGLPYIGALPAYAHTIFALGYGGNGITFSAVAADLIRDWWAGRANPDGDLFRFGR